MIRKKIKILVLTGDGINCERETARAFSLAGVKAEIIHINDLLKAPKNLLKYQALALPGGFSFGDDLGSGQILALKLEYALGAELRNFTEKQKPIIGICNGFQAMVKMGLLPIPFSRRVVALAQNQQGTFLDCWVGLEYNQKSPCIWTKRLKKEAEIQFPIRHGEGRIVFVQGEEKKIFNEIEKRGQIPLYYKTDVNGSYARIASLCDPSGLIFGLMPHPEAATSTLLYPKMVAKKAKGKPGLGLKIFESGVEWLCKH